MNGTETISIKGRTKKDDIKPLTSVRFFAAFAVFLSHLGIFQEYADLKPIYTSFFAEGYVGVTIFFVLSGFILTYNYHDKIASLDPLALTKFYIARFARIFPVHLLTFVIALPFVAKVILDNPIQESLRGLLNILLLQSYVPHITYYYSFNGPSWSLSDELFFYAMMPFALALWIIAKGTGLGRAIGIGLGFWVIAFLIVWQFQDITIGRWLFYVSPYFRFIDFLLGMSLCFVFLRVRTMNIPVHLFTWMELLGVGGLVGAYFFSPSVPQSFRYGVYYAPFICFVILVFAFQKGLITRLLSNGVFVLLGEISYSFYMFHLLVLDYLLVNGILKSNPILGTLVALILTVGISYICYRFYEMPWRDKIKRRFAASVPSTAQSSQLPDVVASTSSIGFDKDYRNQSKAWKFLKLGSMLALPSVIGLAYFPSLRLGFLGEIWNWVEAAARFSVPTDLIHVLNPRVQVAESGLLTGIIFLLEYLAFHFDQWGYHAFRVFVHIANVFLLGAVILKITRRWKIATLAVLFYGGLPVFAPVMFNLVDWQPESGIFYMLGIWFWISFIQTEQAKYYLLTGIAFILAMFIQSASLTFPITLFLLTYFVLGPKHNKSRVIRLYGPFLAVGALYIIVRAVLLSDVRIVNGYNINIVVDVSMNLVESLIFLVYPWAIESPIIFVWIPLVLFVSMFVLVLMRQYRNVMIFLVIEALLLVIPQIWRSRELFTSRYLYLPAMLFAIGLALFVYLLWMRWGRKYSFRVLVSLFTGLIVLANGVGVSDAASDWTNVVRQRRAPFREISARQDNFPDDTLLYFTVPVSIVDIRGMFLSRYGEHVAVASSRDNDTSIRIPYPSLRRVTEKLDNGTNTVFVSNFREHQNVFVYALDEQGKLIEEQVDKDAVVWLTSQPPISFGNSLQLEQYAITRRSVKAGESVILLLDWRAVQKPERDYTIFVHVVKADGTVISGYDTLVGNNKTPMSQWSAGDKMVDGIVVTIPRDVPPGSDYRLEIGLYHLSTMEPLMILDERGLAVDRVKIEPFDIE